MIRILLKQLWGLWEAASSVAVRKCVWEDVSYVCVTPYFNKLPKSLEMTPPPQAEAIWNCQTLPDPPWSFVHNSYCCCSLFHLDFIPPYFVNTQLGMKCSVCVWRAAICDSRDMLLTLDMHGVSRLTWSSLSGRGERPLTVGFAALIMVLALRQKRFTVLKKHPPRQKSITKKNCFVL